jgi:hypothetical protein
MIFKKKSEERKVEAKKAKAVFNSDDFTSINKKLGLRANAPKEKIVFELNRLKNPRTRKALGLTEQDFKQFGIDL